MRFMSPLTASCPVADLATVTTTLPSAAEALPSALTAGTAAALGAQHALADFFGDFLVIG
jgi:hypothetical protein